MNGTVSEYSLPGVDGDVVDGEPVSEDCGRQSRGLSYEWNCF